jgi:hypothetical protein
VQNATKNQKQLLTMHINCTTITERPERFRHYCFWFVLPWIQKEIRRLIAGGFFSA